VNQTLVRTTDGQLITHSGLRALCAIGGYYRIAADPLHLARELALGDEEASRRDIIRAAKPIGLKAEIVKRPSHRRLARAPTPAILRMKSGGYCVFSGQTAASLFRIVDPITRISCDLKISELRSEIEPVIILVARHFLGAGINPRTFGFRWFAPSLWR
jgi:ATP-binding cassette, subfamily B, bacterial HlyB/CyaB